MQHRQLAAILFTDIAGYTAIMAQDETRAKQLRDRFQKVLRECHEKYGGEVVNDLGDGTLSLFSSTIHSVQCSIETQKVLRQEPVVPLRIGIHFGEVVRDAGGVYGHAINIASRLESLSQPGSILVSDRIRKELNNRPEIEFRSLGLFALKNVPEPLEVFAVANQGISIPQTGDLEGKAQRLTSAPAIKQRAQLVHFVGRERELKALRKAWTNAQSGQGTMIGIAGEPGIGKTTLVEDFLLELEEGNDLATSARGRCSERMIGTEAFLPFLEILERLTADPSQEAILKQLAPAWYVLLKPYSTNESEVLEIAARANQERRKRELLFYLKNLAQAKPVILFIDDWHWADISSVDLITYLAPRLSDCSLLILTTYRPADMKQVDHPFIEIQAGLEAKRLFREIPLPFLQSAEVSHYLQSKYPANKFQPDFAKLLHKRTEGSPLFMADLVEDLEERGLIHKEQGFWQINMSELKFEKALPVSISSMIKHKINLLEEKDRKLLSLAAVQGYEFDGATLAAVLSRDVIDIEDQLRKLESHSRLVKLSGEKRFPDGRLSEQFHFVHVLYRNALFDQLSLGRRARWSRQVAEVLKKTYEGRNAEIASQLAPLYEWAQDQESAIAQYALAANHASAIRAFHEAEILVQRGLNLISKLEQKESTFSAELEFVRLLAEASIATKGYGHPDVYTYHQRALEICHNIDDPATQIPSLLGLMSTFFMKGDLAKNKEIKSLILALSEQLNHPGYIGTTYFLYGATQLSNGILLEGRSNLVKALELLQKAPEKAEEVKLANDIVLGCLGWTSWAKLLTGYPEQSRQLYTKMLDRGREQSSFDNGYALMASSIESLWLLDTDALLTKTQEAIHIAKEQDFPFILAYSSVLRGWALVYTNQDVQGLRMITSSLRDFTKRSETHFHLYFTVLLAEAYWRGDQIEDAWRTLQEALEIYKTSKEVFCVPELYRLQGDLLYDTGGTLSDVETSYSQAIEIARQHGSKWWELRSTISLARLWQKQDRYQQAYDKLKEIYDWFTEGFDTVDLKEAKKLLDELEEEIKEANKPPSIAVLPFVNMSSDPEQEYFCDGITEEILNALAQVKDLKVIARTSAFSFKGQSIDIREIGEKLGVDHILEGSVRKSGNKIRITAQLIMAEDGSHLWSERYDRNLEDIFIIQDEIAQIVASRFRADLRTNQPDERGNTQNLQAFELYMQGRFLFYKRSVESLEKAILLYKQALQLDPFYSQAYAGLADAYILMAIGYGKLPSKIAYGLAEEAAKKAIHHNIHSAEAHTSLGYVNFALRRKEQAEKHFKTALAINPSLAQVHQWYAQLLLSKKEFQAMADHFNKALELDPLSILLRTESGWYFIYTGKYKEGIQFYQQILELEPSFWLARYDLAACFSGLGKFNLAERELEIASEQSRNNVFTRSYLAYVSARSGKTQKALAILHELTKIYDQGAPISSFIADVYIGLGDRDQAINWLEKAMLEEAYILVVLDQWINRHLGSQLLDNDPRYHAILEKLGLKAGNEKMD